MLSNTFLLVRRTHLPIFIPFIDGFPQIMDQNMDHLSKTKSIADMYCLVCIRILYSKMFNNIHEKWIIQVDSFPISSHILRVSAWELLLAYYCGGLFLKGVATIIISILKRFFYRRVFKDSFAEGLVARDAFQIPRHQLKRPAGVGSWLAPGNIFAFFRWYICLLFAYWDNVFV